MPTKTTADEVKRLVNGHSVKAIREALGHRGGEFAIRCTISHAYLSNVEAGRKQPSAAVARRIADELGVPLVAITYPALVESKTTAA